MILPGSRYEHVRLFDPVRPETPGLLRARDISPVDEVLEHSLAQGDRADTLALHYYADPRQWYRVLDSNPQVMCASDLEVGGLEGHVIIIPRGRS